LDEPERTTVEYSLPRIARHLTSIGVFGPGFGAVVPKWGGGAEIAQVACRAGAVGGGVYVLGTGVATSIGLRDGEGKEVHSVTLSNRESVKARHLVSCDGVVADSRSTARTVSKIIAVVSSPLTSIYAMSIEGAPSAAVSVIIFPSKTLQVEEQTQTHPVYIMAHSSETGECPAGQCVLYATTLHSSASKTLLEAALTAFLQAAENGGGKLLYKLYYEQQEKSTSDSLDLAFDDRMLEEVEKKWADLMQDVDEEQRGVFMQFEERRGMDADEDEDGVNGY